MWWRKKKENEKDKITRIIRETLSKPGLSIESLAERLSREGGIKKEAALSLSKQLVDEFLGETYDKRIGILKQEFSEIFSLPYSPTNLNLINKEVEQLGKSVIDSNQFLDNTFEIRQLESEAWLTKGEKLRRENKLQDALNCFDISLKFNPYNLDTFAERGKLLQDLNFHKDAIRDFTKIIEDNKSDFSVIYLRGCSYLRFCDFENALADIEKAIELSKLANDRQRQVAKDKGFDSLASMYKTSLELLEMLKDSPNQVIIGMREKNGKERGV